MAGCEPMDGLGLFILIDGFGLTHIINCQLLNYLLYNFEN